MRNHLGLTFKELYRSEQLRMGVTGPIDIHAATHTLLFLRGCAEPRVCKTLCITRLLQQLQTPLGFCCHLAELCSRFPTYQSKVRALSSIRLYLEGHSQKQSTRFTIKAISSFDTKAIKSWAKNMVVQAGIFRPNWVIYIYICIG